MIKTNNSKYLSALVLFVYLLSIQNLNASETKSKCSIYPQQLKCEYLVDPQGIDIEIPRFSWTLTTTDDKRFGQKQTAYRIIVSQTENNLNNNMGDMWDSGWIQSDQMQLIEYAGKRLSSDRKYFWKVCVKDEKGKISEYSQPATWTTGLFSQFDWTSQWIGTSQIFDPTKSDCNITDPWLRKKIDLSVKPQKATMFIASIGYHELYVNGKKIGNHVLAPAATDHTKRVRYIAYDIADELKEGANVIALWLGTGWSIFYGYQTHDRQRTPMVKAQADIYDGNMNIIQRIETDDSWKTYPSPNALLGTFVPNNFGGEIWDANKDIPDWNSLSYDDSKWENAVVYYPKLELSAQMVEGNYLYQEIKPVAIETLPDGNYRVDMGVNFAGWTEIKVKGDAGSRIDFLFSEREQLEMTFKNRSAIILDNSGSGTFKNRFNYSSGRWITIKGATEKPKLEDIKGWLVRTGYDSASTFECSDELQNWMYDRILWTFENLSIGGMIVDCPQRERMGYGGDAHATSETGLLNYKMGAFYTKWMQDWRDVQGTEPMVGNMNDPNWAGKNVTSGRIFNNGILPHAAPTYCGGGGPPWGGICVTIPWLLYKNEGDIRVIEENMEMIKGWLAFLDSHTEDNLLKRFGGRWDFLGDWLWPNATAEGMNNDKPENLCYNNCFRVYNLRTAAKMARLIGRTDEAEKWERQAEESSIVIHDKYFNKHDNSYADGSMACLTAALIADIPPKKLKEDVMKRLEHEIIVVRKGHIHVGITAGGLLFNLLREMRRDDLIYSMTSKTDYPSWGFMRENGATTIWEMWEKDLRGHSFLHSSYLYPASWYIDGLSGIRRDSGNPGFRKFDIMIPELDESQISWVRSCFDSPAGKISIYWKRENGHLHLEVTVPPNCEATLYFPSDKKIIETSKHAKKIGEENGYILYNLVAGSYTFNN